MTRQNDEMNKIRLTNLTWTEEAETELSADILNYLTNNIEFIDVKVPTSTLDDEENMFESVSEALHKSTVVLETEDLESVSFSLGEYVASYDYDFVVE
jgi:hypothetical protein